MRHLRTLFLILLFLPWGAVKGGSQLEISHLARSLQPGEAVLIKAKSAEPLSSMQVEAFGKTFLFYPSEEGRVWQGLVGIDLETTPDDYSLSLTGATASGFSVDAAPSDPFSRGDCSGMASTSTEPGHGFTSRLSNG